MQRGIAGGAAIIWTAIAVWALRPIAPRLDGRSQDSTLHAALDQVSNEATPKALFDESLLDVRLWNAPAPPPAPPPPPPLAAPPPAAPAPPPMRLQLIAIVRDPRSPSPAPPRAAIFDPERDQLRYVEVGQSIGRWTIRGVSDSGVELSDGQTITRLDITRTDAPSASEGKPR